MRADSGVPAALGYAEQADIQFGLGIIRNHYVGRTFIDMQVLRVDAVQFDVRLGAGAVLGRDAVLELKGRIGS